MASIDDIQLDPLEFWLLSPTPEDLIYLRPVTSLDIFDGASTNLAADGLFSIDIFGYMGSNERDNMFSYIDIKTSIIHPKLMADMIRLKGFYQEIISGKSMAVFDPVLKDFVKSTDEDAETGYSFFVRHLPSIEFVKNKSVSRNERIDFVNKWKNDKPIDKLMVIPAGFRDIDVGTDGRVTKHEINDLYYRALSIANTIFNKDPNNKIYDPQRYSLHLVLVQIYEMIFEILGGKNGKLLGKLGSRTVRHGTANVVSVQLPARRFLTDTNAPGFDSATHGIYQTAKALEPLTIHLLRTRYLDNVFTQGESRCYLINKETLHRELVELPSEVRDRWTTKEGLVTIINRMSKIEARHRYVEEMDRYVLLIYKGPDSTFKIMYDIDELPAHLDKKHVHPITLCELIYLVGYNKWNDYIVHITRYPFAGIDSNRPFKNYVMTTTVGEIRYELDYNWEIDKEAVALEFPRRDIESFLNTSCPPSGTLSGFAMDFDGDRDSCTFVMTDQAVAEGKRYLSSRKAWVSGSNTLRTKFAYDTVKYVVTNMTFR